MRYLDLSYEGRQVAERGQLDNGKLPHGGYKGSKRHPPSLLSFAKGKEFQHKLGQEIDKLLSDEELMLHGSSPTWSILVHREPSFTDESPLITNNFLAASKLEQVSGVSIHNQNSVTSGKFVKPIRHNGRLYYRPNSTHQFLSATDLRNCTENEVNLQHGRPTRTTLLRALQRRHSASANLYHTRREFLHRLYDLRNSSHANSSTEFLKFETAKDREPLHSFLTGARYNRYNPDLGCYFGESKLQGTRKKIENLDAHPPTPDTPKSGDLLASLHRFRPATSPLHKTRNVVRAPERTQSQHHFQNTPLKLKVIGNTLPVGQLKDSSIKLPNLRASANNAERYSTFAADDTFRIYRYSSASNSTKEADSDVQNVSESLRNATIVSDDEVPVVSSETAGTVTLQVINLDDGVKERDAEANISEISETSVRVPSALAASVSVPSVARNIPRLEDRDSEKAEEELTEELSEEGLPELNIKDKFIECVAEKEEEEKVDSDDNVTIDDEADKERDDEEAATEEEAEIYGNNGELGNDKVDQVNDERCQDPANNSDTDIFMEDIKM